MGEFGTEHLHLVGVDDVPEQAAGDEALGAGQTPVQWHSHYAAETTVKKQLYGHQWHKSAEEKILKSSAPILKKILI